MNGLFNVAKTVTLNVSSSVIPSPGRLTFGATKAGPAGALIQNTPAQTVTLSYTGLVSPAWTATVDQAWVQLTNASGSGPGLFTVSVVNPANVIGGNTSLTATITVTAANIGALSTIPVTLTVDQSGGGAPPFGVVDTPVQNAAGVEGSIGVTGWALDDVGISSVKLYRKCLAFEPIENCQSVGGLVYMGDADIVPGARPDVEAVYPNHPQVYRAGWGFLLLTNMLPHIPNGLMYGGQGSISIYVYATDMEGHQQLLGRTVFDQTPTTITMANDTAAKPFGAIDTPAQGQTVSGGLWNFGWVVTPDSDTTAGNGDIEIPTGGSTIWVWIDGVPVSTVIYNLCRGNVGSPPPPEVYCNDDVANIFGNLTPQPLHTTRTSNPT